MIKLTNVNKFYNKGKSNQIHVLNNISLELPDKSLVTILGASGSGKSTLLNVIGGLDKANGIINYNNDITINKYSPKKLDTYRNNNIGYIFQNYHLINELNVYENLRYALDLIGITDNKEVNEKIDYALELVGMKRFKRRNALALSGGQRQRVAIARAIVKGAKVLIADEPTGNLDENNTIEVMNLLKTISKTYLVLLITHDKEIASIYSDRIINLVDGKIVSDDQLTGNNTLQSFGDKIYLDQLNKNELNNNDNNINIFSDNTSNLNLNVYIKDNVIYLDLKDKNTKVIGLNSNIKIEENTPKEIEVEPVDLSIFNKSDTIYKNNYFKYFLSKLSNSFATYFERSKKMKFLSVLFFIFGFYIYSGLAVLNFFTVPDLAPYQNVYYETIYVDTPSSYIYEDCFDDMFIAPTTLNYVDVKVPLYFNQIANTLRTSVVSNYHFDNIEDLEDDEVILTKKTADSIYDSINKYTKINRSDLINREIIINDKVYKIVGMNDLETDLLIVNYNNFYNINYKVLDYNYNFYLKDDLNYDFPEFNSSNDFPKAFTTFNYQVPDLDTNYLNIDLYNAVIFLTEEDYSNYIANNLVEFRYNPKLVLTEGKLPNKQGEVVLPSIFKGNDKFSLDIVGYYELEVGETPYIYGDYRDVLFYNNSRNYNIFTNDKDKVLEELTNLNIACGLEKDKVIDTQKTILLLTYASGIGQVIFYLGIIVLITFFVARAKMISKIRTVGIYRAIGSSKKRIYIAFMTDSIVLTTMTVIVGLTIAHIFQSSINYSFIPVTFGISTINFILAIIGIYVIMIAASLLPIFTLLRKTPIEINAKYDI